MSEQINDFDQIFRERLSEQTAPPPPAVWENIQSTRSFGHIVANKISTNWGMFGTLLMLLLAGGSAVFLFGEEERNNTSFQLSNIEPDQFNAAELVHEVESLQQQIMSPQTIDFDKVSNQLQTVSFATAGEPQVADKEVGKLEGVLLPSAELIASMEQAAFVRPQLKDERLSAYLETLEGWDDAKPKWFVRYEQMDDIAKKGVFKSKLEKYPIQVELEDYDYVMPRVERKSFRERSSILLSFTPQSVTKIMNAEYNLSSSYLKMRDKTERIRMAYTFGALLHYEMKNHKFLETGVNFTQIYEEMHYEGEKRFSNQYDIIEIPVLIGYGDRNSKWGWEVKGGLGVQVYNSYQGYILKRLDEFGGEPEPQNQYRLGSNHSGIQIINSNHTLSDKQARHEVLDLENEEENPYKSSGVVNVHFASGLIYYHSIKTSFVITPSYRRSINSITKGDALFNERLQSVGISFGARMKF